MVPIQMVDLKRQYLNIKTEVDQAIADVVQNASFINGKAVTDFSAQLGQFLGIDHVVPCANGTDALQIAMMALGLEPGDEVITPSFTYIATTEVMALLRLNLFALIPARFGRPLPLRPRRLSPFICMDNLPPWKKSWPSQRSLDFL